MFFREWSNFEIWIMATIMIIMRYTFIAGIFYYIFYVWKKKEYLKFKIAQGRPRIGQMKREVAYSILTFTIYGGGIWLFLFWIEMGKTQRYTEIEQYGVAYFFSSIILMVLMHDTYFYWTHRLIHNPRLFKHVHKIHHSFKSPTPWAAFAFHPLEAIISIGIIPIIIFLIPYHQFALIIFITFLTVYNVIIHLGFSVPIFSPFKYQNTSMNHDSHHFTSHGNYGLYFTFWDRMMGTYIK